MKRTKLQCLKMFQRHNLSCKEENKKGGEKKKNKSLSYEAAATGSFFIAAAADSALEVELIKDLVLEQVRGEVIHGYIFLMGL